jgi:hypothetical protein
MHPGWANFDYLGTTPPLESAMAQSTIGSLSRTLRITAGAYDSRPLLHRAARYRATWRRPGQQTVDLDSTSSLGTTQGHLFAHRSWDGHEASNWWCGTVAREPS